MHAGKTSAAEQTVSPTQGVAEAVTILRASRVLLIPRLRYGGACREPHQFIKADPWRRPDKLPRLKPRQVLPLETSPDIEEAEG